LSEKLLCSGEGCPIRADCAHWDGNNDCEPPCEGMAYFVKPPWRDGFCDEHRPFHRGRPENGDGA